MKKLFQKDPRFSDTRNPGLLKTKTKKMLSVIFIIWLALFLMMAGKMWNRSVISSAAKKIAKSAEVTVQTERLEEEKQYDIAELLETSGSSVKSYPLNFDGRKDSYEQYITDQKVTYTFYKEGSTKEQAVLELIQLDDAVEECEKLQVNFDFDMTDASYFCYIYRLGGHQYALKVNGHYAYLNIFFVKGLWNMTMAE